MEFVVLVWQREWMFVCVYLCACNNDIFSLVLITNQKEGVLITEKLIGYIVQM